MQLDFSGDDFPVASFENAVQHDADGYACVPVCGVPLRLRQSEILGGRLWLGGMRLALEIERGIALRELGEGGEGASAASLVGKRVAELGAGCAGLPGVALALRHKMRVTLTEHPDVIPILRENIDAVKSQVAHLAARGEVDRDAADAVAAISVLPLDWNDHEALRALATGAELDDEGRPVTRDDPTIQPNYDAGFPLVVWADAGYFSEHTALLRAAAALVAPTGVVLAVESLRSESATRSFRRAFGAAGLFAVRVLGEGDLRVDETWTLAMEWQNRAEARQARRAVAEGRFDKSYGERGGDGRRAATTTAEVGAKRGKRWVTGEGEARRLTTRPGLGSTVVARDAPVAKDATLWAVPEETADA